MKRVALFSLLLFAVALLSAPVVAQDDTQSQPIRSDVQETEKVRLVMVETLALTHKQVTVSDLTKDDFEMKVGGKPVEIDTFDVLCPIGDLPDPGALKKGDPMPALMAPQMDRKIVLVFDYFSIPIENRPLVLDAAKWMVNAFKTPAEEIMVVAFTDRLRIEQRFTKDKEAVLETLTRMEHDVTLWAREFGLGTTGQTYLENMAVLMEVLEAYDGAKIAVLYSQLVANPQTRDIWHWDVAMRAPYARTAIYPSWAGGVTVGSDVMGSRILSRFATDTGGRSAAFTNDLSLTYRRAQRDLSCRYALGFYLETDDEPDRRRTIRVATTRENVKLRTPEMIKMFTDDQKREMRERAAFADPQGHENTLVRAYAMPMRPNGGQWDTLLGLHFSMPVGTEAETINLKAHLRRGAKRTANVDTTIEIPARLDGKPGTQNVTVLGDTTLKPGDYDFTIVLSQEGNKEVVSAHVMIKVPEVPKEGVFVRGPVLARVVPEGVLIRKARDPKDEEETELDKVLKENETIEPLVIHSISRSDKFLAYWEACFAGKKGFPKDAKIVRRFYGEGGEVTLELDPIPFRMPEGKGKMVCQNALEEIDPGKLPVHEYTLQVAVENSKGEILDQVDVPLDVNE
jgi:VWFA-related protein